jgi:phosphoglycerate dehydrogenase-like enzyme
VTEHVVWTQWSDLESPEGITLLHPGNAPLDSDAIEPVTFYVPPYLSGRRGFEPVHRMPKLRYLQTPNAGYDDTYAYLRPGLAVCNARGVHDISTAELALALTLASHRGLDTFIEAKAHHEWKHETRRTLWRQRVAIVGFGSIGRTIARLLEPFEVEVHGFSRSGRDGAKTMEVLWESLHTFDTVILILPATPESVGLVNRDFLARMKDDSLLVNVARGSIVVTDDLVAELQTGRIRAAVDVTDPEPLPKGHPLWEAPNLIISPHVGGDSSAFEPRMRELVVRQMQRLAEGAEPDNIVLRGEG